MSNVVHPMPEKRVDPAYPPQAQQPPSYQPQGPQTQQPQYYPPQGQSYPPPGYVQNSQPGQSMVMQSNVTVVNSASAPAVIITGYGRYPTTTQCPHCRNTVLTNVNYKVGCYTWILVVVLFLLGFSAGCCLIPFCVNSCKDAQHSCPSCGNVLGTHRKC